ncbi:MAG: hypothetical protein J5I28_01180 [Acidimicrobiales bacterium]|jgi:hypothetical protein|nr:hypothetical protein [Acidimicrobiales bacterium]HLV90658.1 hypothetical protein [Acidimicrobiia bacterium]
MRDRGHAALELALGVGLLMLPVAIVVLAFGPWSERNVLAEAAAAEGARAVAIDLDQRQGEALVARMAEGHGLGTDRVRVGWCGARPAFIGGATGTCSLERGSLVTLEVEIWVPLVVTPWGSVGGLWLSADHSEPIDLYRSLP